MWNFRRKKKNRLGVSPETVKTVLSAEVPDGLDTELNTEKIPTIDLEVETKVVNPEVKKIKTAVVYEQPVYVPPTHKEIIEELEFCDNYEAAYLIRSLKKENMVLKGKLTKLTKKYDACEADRQMYMKQLNHLHGKTE